jgi:hypothetical protein
MLLGSAFDVEMNAIGDAPLVQRQFGILGDVGLECCKCKEAMYINECYVNPSGGRSSRLSLKNSKY